ncbi:MAG TPA: alpha/beta hydrolase [Myxococcaceae bacterium]|nr:alpha/beta hydrolase [Myxococcaceae bacterium]
MTLEHFVVGDGPRRTVLLHGFLGQGRNLRTLARRWVEADPSRALWVPDLPGHGASPPAGPGAGLRELAEAVLRGARSSGFAQGALSLVGHSMGGRVSLAALRDWPEALVDVTLLDITPSSYDGQRGGTHSVAQRLAGMPERAADRREMQEALAATGLSPGVVAWLLMNLVPDEAGGVRWRLDREWLVDFHTRVGPEDFWDVVAAGERPVRCIRGGRSAFVSDEEVSRMEALGVPVTTLEGAGHELHVEAPEALIEALTAPWPG